MTKDSKVINKFGCNKSNLDKI